MGEGVIGEFGGDRILRSTGAVYRFSTTHVNILYIYIYIYIYISSASRSATPARAYQTGRVKIHSYIKITSAETFKPE